jgi:hypothetical protein
MSNRSPGTDRDITEIAQSFEFMAEDCMDIHGRLDGLTRDDYLDRELLMMQALRRKLHWNIKRLVAMTGQDDPWVADIPY